MDSWTGGEAFEQVDDAEVLWTACADVLREQVSEAVWLTSFNGARPVRIDGDTLVLGVPSSVVRERIEGRYLGLVRGALADVGGADVAARRSRSTPTARPPSPPSNGSHLTHGSAAGLWTNLGTRRPTASTSVDGPATGGRCPSTPGTPSTPS